MIDLCKAEAIAKSMALNDAVKKYKSIMEVARKIDVSTDQYFKKDFCNFYQLKRFYSERFRSEYLGIMQELKNDRDLSFKKTFERVRQIENTCEMSFSSKMLHTLDPSYPIWDSIVTEKHFGMKKPNTKKNIVEKFSERYEEYVDMFYKYMKTEEGKSLISVFDKSFPNSGITDVKKIDFILWQDRGN